MNSMQAQMKQDTCRDFQLLGFFFWEQGSINDNIRKLLKEKGTTYTNTFNGDILVDILDANIWQKVHHLFTDENNTNCLVYVK